MTGLTRAEMISIQGGQWNWGEFCDGVAVGLAVGAGVAAFVAGAPVAAAGFAVAGAGVAIARLALS